MFAFPNVAKRKKFQGNPLRIEGDGLGGAGDDGDDVEDVPDAKCGVDGVSGCAVCAGESPLRVTTNEHVFYGPTNAPRCRPWRRALMWS